MAIAGATGGRPGSPTPPGGASLSITSTWIALGASPMRRIFCLVGVTDQSTALGVMLPVSGFHTDDRYADGRPFLDVGGRLVLASNDNPGSSPSCSMPFVIALRVRKLGLSALEAIQATTSRAADLLGLDDRGRIEPGARADLILLRHHDERMLGYELGGNPVEWVMLGGRVRRDRSC